MDMMQLRKMVMSQMAGAKVKTGTFTGDGTINVSLDIGFDPDVVVIESGVDWSVAGVSGPLNVVFAKGVTISHISHANTGSTSFVAMVNIMKPTEDPYGSESATINQIYCTYSNGVLSFTNISNSARNQFMSGQKFTWTAYKK